MFGQSFSPAVYVRGPHGVSLVLEIGEPPPGDVKAKKKNAQSPGSGLDQTNFSGRYKKAGEAWNSAAKALATAKVQARLAGLEQVAARFAYGDIEGEIPRPRPSFFSPIKKVRRASETEARDFLDAIRARTRVLGC
jgi:hypothetical protein